MPKLATHTELPDGGSVDREFDNIYRSLANAITAAGTTAESILTGTTSPTATPEFTGQRYINTTTAAIWIAGGTSGSYNWGYVGQGSTSAFTKDTISGLVSWYKADDGPSPTTEGTNITSWTDASDTGNTLTTVYGTRAYTSNVQNGLPGIRFATSSYIHGTNKTDRPQPGTIFIVFKGTDWAAGTYQGIYVDNSGGSFQIAKNTGNTNILIGAGTNLIGGAVANNTSTIVTAIFNGASSSVAVNNGPATVGNAGTNTSTSYPLIGALYGGGSGFTGYVMEVLVYTGALTTDQQNIVRSYLNNKYAIY